MDPDALRELLAAHPAVAIQPFGTRRGVLCVRAGDAARLVADAGHEVSEAELESAMSVLGGERLRLVDPAAAPTGPTRFKGGRGRTKPAGPRRPRKGPPLEDLDVYELPAGIFGG
ncbi:hypothetical protein [Patulibacter sp.]|uniref:hypothetical protein n=1 Tax=Patulibacter sp. TaxID=1912859 RepID=UPI00271D359A|nr:hypothetical protein [Patulibacter sp.]MDO9407343.1 hypothetical protein [Patulibacter sp.]